MRLQRLLFITFIFTACVSSGEYKKSDHFDGKHFHNTENPKLDTFWDAVKVSWELLIKKANWPEKFSTPFVQPPTNILAGELKVTFIGHSTVLIQSKDLNVITDPLLFDHIGSGLIKVKAVTNPAMKIEDLPNIDLILISHNHFDHFDIDSVKAIVDRQALNPPQILVGLGVGAFLKDAGISNYLEMDWNESIDYKGSRIYFLEAAHTSRRGVFDTNETLWGAFLIKMGRDSIYYAGDTAYAGHLKRVFEQYGAPTLSLLPIGAYEPRWFMKKEHTNPEEAVLAHLDLHSNVSMAIHFGMFDSALEGFEDPARDLQEAIKKHHLLESSFLTPNMGQTFTFKMKD